MTSSTVGRLRFPTPVVPLVISIAGGVFFGVVGPVTVFADSGSEGDTLQEIVVTAQKREQNLQDVGVSVTALSGDALRSLGITDTMQLGAAIPGLQLNSASGGNYGAQLTIRGVANSDYSPHQESPNSMYLDEVYVSAPNEQGGQMFDMDRTEVLRGPQGTLFGRNSTGGLVSSFTNRPTPEDTGYLELTYGAFNEARLEGAASGPLANGINGRVAFATQNNSGYDKNYYPGSENLNSTNYRGVRFELEFDRIDNFKALFILPYTHDNDNEGFYGHINSYFDPADGGRPVPLPANINAWGTGPGNDLIGYRSPYWGPEGSVGHVGFMRRGNVSPTLNLSWDLGGGTTVTSISNFTKFVFNYDESCSGAPQTTCEDPYQQDLSQWSQELRINGTKDALTWVTGAYAFGTSQEDGSNFLEPYYAGTPDAFSSRNGFSQHLTSESLFGQGEYLFSSNWRGTLGARLTHDQKDFSSQTYLSQEGNGVTDTIYNPPLLIYNFSPDTVGGDATEINTYWSGKAQMDYIVSPAALLYASISRGVKGAGFNANATGSTATLATTPFKQEHVIAYEVGEKLTLFGDRMTLNSSLFYYDYKGYQAYEFKDGPNPFVSNNNGRFEGGEIEVIARPIRGLDLHLGLSGISTLIYAVDTAQIGVANQQATDAPKWSGNAMARYSWDLLSGTASAQWSGDFYSGSYHSVDNTATSYIHGSSGQNVRVAYEQGHWEYSAFCNNVFNNIRQTGAYDFTGSYGYSVATFMPPRWWGISVRFKY
jgi:iron complex outermembrane recepter protein